MLDLTTPMGLAIWKAGGLEEALFLHIRSLTAAGDSERREILLNEARKILAEFGRLNEISFENNPTTQQSLASLDEGLTGLAQADLPFKLTAEADQCRLCNSRLTPVIGSFVVEPHCSKCWDLVQPAIQRVQAGFHLDYDA